MKKLPQPGDPRTAGIRADEPDDDEPGRSDASPYRAASLPVADDAPMPPADAVPARVDLAAAVAAAGLIGRGGRGDGSGERGVSSAVPLDTVAKRIPNPTGGGAARRTGEPSLRKRRRFARERAVQALYQWHMSGASSSDVRREFLATQEMDRVDVAYFEEAFRGVTHASGAVDDVLSGALDRGLDEVDPIERAILRLATWELQNRSDVPPLVVITEGVEIARRFCAEPGYRYVNGVLDALATELRPAEMARS